MNIAILIDAENVLPSHADLIFSHAQERGTIIYREIFGAASALTSWVAPVLKYAMHPNLTIKAAKGKNSSDIALVIGAMDLLVAGNIDCAIIASSDSDFSSLSVRLRNAGIEVIGMGTDKANALWRTACSSFVVLQTPKAAPVQKQQQQQQPKQQQQQKQQQQPKQQQPAKQQQPKQQEPQKQQAQKQQAAEPAATSTHKERVAVIGQAIAKRLESDGGRLQVSTLFPMLNKLPEYKVDRQGSGKRPLNYLTSTYGDIFHFEDTPDGKNWVSLPSAQGGVPAAQAPDAAREPAEPEQQAAPSPEQPQAPVEEASVEEAPFEEAPVEAPAVEEVVLEEPATEAEESAEQDQEEDYATPEQIANRLIDGGFDPEIARQVTDIFSDSASYRAAYNRLRSVFGNNAGREYYQSAKQILTGKA